MDQYQNIENYFKSKGEVQIANFLDENGIKYKYENGVLIYQSQNKPRIWYPDFYLPEFSSYIEYYGMVGDLEYDKGIKVKESAYSKMGLDVISVDPSMFPEKWQGHIIGELEKKIQRQSDKLYSLPYSTNTKFISRNPSHKDDWYIDF